MLAQGPEQPAAHGSHDIRQQRERNARPGSDDTITPLEPFLRRSSGRKIATILSADIVEYTRLMGADEERTLAALKILRTIFSRLVHEFEGHEFGSVGDSLMAQFPSAVNAMRCALTIQRAVATENRMVPTDQRMSLRIGLNLGDVIDEHGTLYGDGVNIAARLQALARPGGVLLSSAVHEQVRGRIAATFRLVGPLRAKNISRAILTYEAIDTDFSRSVLPLGCKSDAAHVTSILHAIPSSIAVLPFINLTGDLGKDSFGDGMAEELIHVLTRVPGLHVPARTSSGAYKGRNMDVRQIASELDVEAVLEGSVRGAGERVRITAQLVDGLTGYHIWSQAFDRRFEEPLRLQHSIAVAIIRLADMRISNRAALSGS